MRSFGGSSPSTVHRILTRHRLYRLAWMDRPTGTVIRRYERDRPGELIHVDVKKLGRIPTGGGHKALGCEAGRSKKSGVGFDYVHSAVDDHSRLAYSEIHPDEKVATCADFLARAAAFFHTQGITRIERVLTDNAWAYRKGLAWKAVLSDIGAAGKLTRAYLPQTNGKVERFHTPTGLGPVEPRERIRADPGGQGVAQRLLRLPAGSGSRAPGGRVGEPAHAACPDRAARS